MCDCVCTCMQCVCVACGGECVRGLWGMWMGHVWVVAGPPHHHHGHLKHGCVGLVGSSYDKCCGGVRACVSDAAACCGVRRCSASLPAVCGALQCRIRPLPGSTCPPKLPPARTPVSSGVCLRWGSLPHPLQMAGRHIPVSAGAQIFEGIRFSGAWCDQAAPTGNQNSRRGRISGCVGMGGVGEGGRERREVR